MPIRKASAVWQGGFRDGKGTVKVGSGLFEGPYSVSSRFEEGKGTNPEELLGAAHAGCFSMALALILGLKGMPPRMIETTADVLIEKVGPGFKITTITLHTEADVPGASDEAFRAAAEDAKVNCPVSQALTGVKINLDARLIK
ncbi:MAG: OsmC family protein [Candidatus Aminicenantales bacterium]